MENDNYNKNSNDSPPASIEPCVNESDGFFEPPSADACFLPSGSTITLPSAIDDSSAIKATSIQEHLLTPNDQADQQSIPNWEVSGATGQDKPMSANSELKKQMTILDPALQAATVPSIAAPTVYALASKVPFPTVNQLTMSIPNQPVVQEQVAVPFKTILCTPPSAGTTFYLQETTDAHQDQQQTQQHERTPEDQSKTSSSAVLLSQSPVHDDLDQVHDDLDQFPGIDSQQNSIHPYFAAAKFPERPQLSRSRSQYSSAESSVGSRPTVQKRRNSGQISPPLPATSFFATTSNSDTVPVHHAVHDKSLDPSLVKKKADERQKAQDEEATAAADGNSFIGSRTTVFGFAPLYNKGDHQATMRSDEERVLKDSLVCRAMPLSGRLPPSHNYDLSALPGEASPSKDMQSPTEDGKPQGIPHVRAGISRTLNLDQLESNVELTVTDSEESVETLIETKDWSKTGLGPRSSWPAELNMLMPLLMRSASPLAIYWGDQNYLIYNDAWRPILKQKHPLAMGMPGAAVWSEIWDLLGAQIHQVRKEGRGNDNKGLRLDLHREGYEEECYFDFTFSPIFLNNDLKSVGGIFANVQEVTQSILNQRRLMTLNQFSKQAPLIQSVTGAYSMITTILQESNNLDIPFSIVYSTKDLAKDPCPPPISHGTFSPPPSQPVITPPAPDDILAAGDHAGKCGGRRAPQAAILCSTSFDRKLEVVDYGGVREKIFSKATSTRHIPDSLLITPEDYEPLDPSAPVYDDPWAWPVRSVLADGVPRLVTLPKSTHKLARAILLPILENPSVLDSRITTILIVGINPFQMLDNQYLDFLALLVANIASLLHFGRSREEERKSTEALFELNKAKISFFQNISHELRTPLTLMLAPLDDVLLQTPEKAPTRANLEMIRRNSRRLLKLVNTLLQFSRIEAGKGLAIFEETDLSKATREVSANFESVARGFNLDYIINCEDLSVIPGGIWVDRAMWAGIILNLIGNALKHTWSGSVTVHQYPAKGKSGRDGVAVDVVDTGVGISAEHLHSLFGRFNRIENKQSRSHEGTGIGLSLVKELTEVHGGNVSVTSEVDKGTCFHLWIPAGRSHHPSSQIKLGDSNEAGQNPRTFDNDMMNNKTDASMYVEEATQWISQKSLPGSTLTASGTDSTEEEKPEDDDDTIHLGLDYMRDRQDSIEINQEYEVSTLNLDEDELSKILIDPPEDGEVIVADHESAKLEVLRSTSTAHSPRLSIVPGDSSFAFKEQAPSAMSISPTDRMFDTSINDDGGFGSQIQSQELVDEPEDNKATLARARSRRSFIIVVDDNNDMRAYLREILGKDFRVRCAVDGLDAIRLISERLHQGKRIDLVLSDVAMPNMNGYELLKRLRNDSATMMTPFILLSARAGEEANVEGLDLGADDCLVKPFSARELLARVRSTIRLSDLRYELIREQRHAMEMKQLIYSISVRIRSGLSLPQILDTASMELFKVIRCNAIRICRFRRVDPESGQHWVRFVSEIVSCGKPKVLTPTDRLFPKGLEVNEIHHAEGGDTEMAGDLRHISNYQHPVFGAKNFISVALIYNRRIWGYLLASRDADTVDWSQSEKLLFEQTGNQISLAIAHASLWELKKSQQVEMEAAHAANEAKSQILANTSHELRTPIGAIVGALSALEDTDYNLTGEQRDMVKIMQITSDVALSVINDLLDTAKLEAGAMSLTIKECPGLAETLEQSVRIFADKAGRKEVDLVLDPSEELDAFVTMVQQGAAVWTDGDRLQQVIMNLIGNAVKFTANGKVVIQCSISKGGVGAVQGSASSSPIVTSPLAPLGEGLDVRGSSSSTNSPAISPHARIHHLAQIPPDAQVTHGILRFEVSDTGIGIDPEFLKNHIFKSFAQYDQSMTRRFGGTGLGLAISKHLVMMNGGILGVTSNVGQGSTFYFTWPITLVWNVHPTVSLQRPLTARPALSAELAFETRAVVVEPVPEARNMLGWILNQQSIEVTLYEGCETVVNDELARSPDLLGPDGKVLIANYRPNVHFFFCTRSATAEVTIRTARELGEHFKAKNAEAKLKETQDHRDLIVSIVLVVFSSAQGRSLAKDMIKRIRGGGLEQTVLCRYIVKPVKTERVIECLQMQGSYAPFTRGIDGSSEAMKDGPLQNSGYSGHAPHHRPHQPHHHHRQSNSRAEDSSHVIRADGSMGSVPGDYDRDDYCNKNTEYLSANQSPVSNESSSANSPQQQFPTPLGFTGVQAEVSPRSTLSSRPRSSTATQRRLRLRANAEAAGGSLGRGCGKNSKTSGTDDSVKSSSDNPAFSNRAARAAAGKRERKGKCILCVEDNIINLRVVQYQLQKLGYDTQSACDGQVAVDIIKAQIEMLAQHEATESTFPVEGTIVDATATESGTDGETAVGSVDDETGGRGGLHTHSTIGKELLAVSPESNGNMSHIFDPTEQEVDSPSTLVARLPIPAASLQSSAASSVSLALSSLSSSCTSVDQPIVSGSPSVVSGGTSTGLPPVPTALSMGPMTPLLTKARKVNRSQGERPKIDLILMDCAMPVKSGFDAASEIRAMGAESGFAAAIPIIALTASAVASTKEKCLAAGMNGYLSKPTKLADLEDMLNQWIE